MKAINAEKHFDEIHCSAQWEYSDTLKECEETEPAWTGGSNITVDSKMCELGLTVTCPVLHHSWNCATIDRIPNGTRNVRKTFPFSPTMP
jgi:hypothetical protein